MTPGRLIRLERPVRNSLDNLVGEREQCWRYGEPERAGGIEIDHQLEFGRLLDRQIFIAQLQHVSHYFCGLIFVELLLCAAGAPRWAVDPRLRQRRRQLFMPPVDAGAADAISSSVARRRYSGYGAGRFR